MTFPDIKPEELLLLVGDKTAMVYQRDMEILRLNKVIVDLCNNLDKANQEINLLQAESFAGHQGLRGLSDDTQGLKDNG